ncbi:hypothetical protein AWC38_SpisGene20370 [Stylophora pistillata]|uniref:PHD-type domain-containing protein n=1 Tax=Stylophora pistillata TaxID=50429 RepID=A0A2B4RAP6_STYPI|nr:hypothetical protein AWC38_SpisGene20370 [Stylophora pistillata]
MTIQCDSCDKWFHAKCISMKRTKYDELCEPSLAWECITCLSPGFDTPVRKSHETINTGVKEGKPSGRINKDLHANLKKRGMKFAHVNIATLRDTTDAEVLMEKEALDVFAVTESRLDCTLLDSKICPLGYTCYTKDRNRNSGGCAVFVRSKWPSKRRSDLETDCLEMVCVEICPEKAKNTIFAVMYKPPIKKAGVCKAHVEIRDVRSFKHCDKNHFRKDVASVPWSVIESFDDINDAVVAWNNLFVDVANQHAPLKIIRTKHASKPWITNDLKELMAERHYALRVAKRYGNQEQWNEYRRLKNFTNRKIKSAEAFHYKNLIESAENPKDMWRSLNSVIGSNNQWGSPFQVHNGKPLVSEPKSIATKFNKFLAAIGSKVAVRLRSVSKDAWKKYETVKEANEQSDIKSILDFQRVEQNTVQSILHSLKVNKAAGLDRIPARVRLLKDAEAELAPSITYLVNRSISDSILPDLWKFARVTRYISLMINCKLRTIGLSL